ncbi:hypothetical protein VNO78_27017 [Psophocarpus tetragonolobus]|uniref:Uncharacterized protein n=1 Tax=Psophocarpus tetragonolobus TaxID=3891 RepID=A0AAN9X9V5_PSOTE
MVSLSLMPELVINSIPYVIFLQWTWHLQLATSIQSNLKSSSPENCAVACCYENVITHQEDLLRNPQTLDSLNPQSPIRPFPMASELLFSLSDVTSLALSPPPRLFSLINSHMP